MIGSKMNTPRDSVQRSVNALERIYAVVVALAITRAIERVMFDHHGVLIPFNGTPSLGQVVWAAAPAIIAFLATIVPFYQGMDRHLSRTYVERSQNDIRSGFLILDFFIFFLEACLLLVFATLVNAGVNAFVPLMLLLVLDTAWAIVAYGIHYRTFPGPLTWAVINASAIVLFLLVYCSNLFDLPYRPAAMAAIAVCRTAADYILCWGFYFPTKAQAT